MFRLPSTFSRYGQRYLSPESSDFFHCSLIFYVHVYISFFDNVSFFFSILYYVHWHLQTFQNAKNIAMKKLVRDNISCQYLFAISIILFQLTIYDV